VSVHEPNPKPPNPDMGVESQPSDIPLRKSDEFRWNIPNMNDRIGVMAISILN
jgi:hypothetical protein